MTLLGLIFYLLGAVVAVATALAVTRRNPVHAVVYLTISFFGTAPLFYLLGAPFLAMLEVIIYAGAIMVLFLFIIMMMEIAPGPERGWALARQWLPALVLAALTLAITAWLIAAAPGGRAKLPLTMATPREFGRYLFQQYWYPVEIVSLLLFVALVGALFLGRRERPGVKEAGGSTS